MHLIFFFISLHKSSKINFGGIIRQLIILPSLQSHPPCLLELPPPKRLTRIKPSISEGERKESMSFHAAHWTYSAKKGPAFLWIIILNNRPACTMIFMLPDFIHWKIYVWTITFKALNWTSVREQNWYSLGHSSFCTPVIVEGKKQSFSNNIQIHIVGCHVRWWTFGLVQSDRTLGIILERNSEFDVSARPAVIS